MQDSMFRHGPAAESPLRAARSQSVQLSQRKRVPICQPRSSVLSRQDRRSPVWQCPKRCSLSRCWRPYRLASPGRRGRTLTIGNAGSDGADIAKSASHHTPAFRREFFFPRPRFRRAQSERRADAFADTSASRTGSSSFGGVRVADKRDHNTTAFASRRRPLLPSSTGFTAPYLTS